jgi:hypothetical protein
VIDLPKEISETGEVETQNTTQAKAAHWKLVSDQTHVTPAVLNHKYHGSGTEDNRSSWSTFHMTGGIRMSFHNGRSG